MVGTTHYVREKLCVCFAEIHTGRGHVGEYCQNVCDYYFQTNQCMYEISLASMCDKRLFFGRKFRFLSEAPTECVEKVIIDRVGCRNDKFLLMRIFLIHRPDIAASVNPSAFLA